MQLILLSFPITSRVFKYLQYIAHNNLKNLAKHRKRNTLQNLTKKKLKTSDFDFLYLK